MLKGCCSVVAMVLLGVDMVLLDVAMGLFRGCRCCWVVSRCC